MAATSLLAHAILNSILHTKIPFLRDIAPNIFVFMHGVHMAKARDLGNSGETNH